MTDRRPPQLLTTGVITSPTVSKVTPAPHLDIAIVRPWRRLLCHCWRLDQLLHRISLCSLKLSAIARCTVRGTGRPQAPAVCSLSPSVGRSFSRLLPVGQTLSKHYHAWARLAERPWPLAVSPLLSVITCDRRFREAPLTPAAILPICPDFAESVFAIMNFPDRALCHKTTRMLFCAGFSEPRKLVYAHLENQLHNHPTVFISHDTQYHN